MKRVIIFGAGEGGRRALRHLRNKADIVCILDNDPQKHGTKLSGIPVCAPARATEPDVEQILIASIHGAEIFDQLLELGVDMRKIDIIDQDLLQDFAGFPKGIRNLLISLGILILFALLSWFW